MGFSVNFQASTGKKLRENKDGNSYGTCKFDAKHSTIVKRNTFRIFEYTFYKSLADWIRYLMSYITNLKNYNIILFYLQIEGAPEIFPRQKSKHER